MTRLTIRTAHASYSTDVEFVTLFLHQIEQAKTEQKFYTITQTTEHSDGDMQVALWAPAIQAVEWWSDE